MYMPFSHEAHAWRSHVLNSLWSIASPYFLYGIYSYLMNRNERYYYTRKSARIMLMFEVLKFDKK